MVQIYEDIYLFVCLFYLFVCLFVCFLQSTCSIAREMLRTQCRIVMLHTSGKVHQSYL